MRVISRKTASCGFTNEILGDQEAKQITGSMKICAMSPALWIIIRVRSRRPIVGIPTAEQEREPMKQAVRVAVLMVGIVGTFVAASVAQVPAYDGGSIPLCPPQAMDVEKGLCK
jgi:hypothetical protein